MTLAPSMSLAEREPRNIQRASLAYTVGMTEARKKLAIIDGNSVFYRGYYAMPFLSTKDGTPTGGVYGFAVMGLELVKQYKPDYVCVAWDKKGTSTKKRKAIYPEYKAGRKTPPPDFFEQIPVLHDLLKAFNWPLYELDNYEADDIIGTLAKQANDQGIDVMLISSDLDMLQLVGDLSHMYALKKGFSNIELFNPETFEQKYGISVHQFVDLKALKGDSSDNLPGVPGIGEKGAIKLLQEHKTLDGIYENIDLISGATHKKLVEGKELAYMTQELGKIWCDAPIKLDLDAMDSRHIDAHGLLEMLTKLEFRSLVRQLPEIMQVSAADQKIATHGTITTATTQLITKITDIKVPAKGSMLLHTYSRGKHGRDVQYIAVSFDGRSVYVIDADKVAGKERARFFDSVAHLSLIGYDLKTSLQVIIEHGAAYGAIEHDVLIGGFLINSLRREQTLGEMARADIGYEGGDLEHIDPQEFLSKVGDIVAIIYELKAEQDKELEDLPRIKELAQTIEYPVIPVLARMEHRGIKLDSAYLATFSEQLRDSISDLEQQIYGYADQEFNIASPTQLSEILFEKLALPTTGVKKGKTGYSTAAAELDKLRELHPIVDLISQYREVTKLMSTYVETLPKQVDEHGRLHTTYSMTVAQTGRLSSNDPNLQNIPVRTELGREIRKAFIPEKGNKLISADYSQLELRILAHMSGEPFLVESVPQSQRRGRVLLGVL